MTSVQSEGHADIGALHSSIFSQCGWRGRAASDHDWQTSVGGPSRGTWACMLCSAAMQGALANCNIIFSFRFCQNQVTWVVLYMY